MIDVTETARGFTKLLFKDRYDAECSLQMSSLASEAAIWFGLESATPIVLASEAKQVGVVTKETTGWVEYPIPKEVMVSTRMHLTQDQVIALLPILQRFAETGEL